MRRSQWLALWLLAVLLMAAPALAQEPVLRVAVPVENAEYLSLSPDGSRLLLAQGDQLTLVDVATGQETPIVPEPGMDPDYKEKMLPRLLSGAIEDAALVWSADGRYAALSFPRMVLQMMRPGVNILLIDGQAGTVRTVVKGLPFDKKAIFSGDDPVGMPFRAVFDRTAPILYFESYGVTLWGVRKDSLQAYDCETGQSTTVAWSDPMYTTGDPRLWMASDGRIVTTMMHVRDRDQYGLLVYGQDGTVTPVTGPADQRYRQGMERSRVVDLKGDRGILCAENTQVPVPGRSCHLFTMDDLGEDLFRYGIAVAAGQLVTYDVLDMMDHDNPLFKQYIAGELYVPINGALSPDGQRALLVAANINRQWAMYLCDLTAGQAAQVAVDVPDAQEGDGYGVGYPPSSVNKMHNGLRWLDNGQIILDVRGAQYICALG